MEGPCWPVSVNPKLGCGCEGTPKVPQRWWMFCVGFSIGPPAAVRELMLFWTLTSTIPFVSLELSVVLDRKLSSGSSWDWGLGSYWDWLLGWIWGWRKVDDDDGGSCDAMFGCCGGLVSSRVPLQFATQLKPLWMLLLVWCLSVSFLTSPPETDISIPPLTETTISAGGLLWLMEKGNGSCCCVLGGWNNPGWFGFTWGITCSWGWIFVASLSIALFRALSPTAAPLCRFTSRSWLFAPSLPGWDLSLRLSIILVQRCSKLLSLSLSRTPPRKSPCFPCFFSFSFIFFSFSLARSCFFLLFSSLSRWRSCAVTGRRDSGTEYVENETPPARPESMPRTKAPPFAKKNVKKKHQININ